MERLTKPLAPHLVSQLGRSVGYCFHKKGSVVPPDSIGNTLVVIMSGKLYLTVENPAFSTSVKQDSLLENLFLT